MKRKLAFIALMICLTLNSSPSVFASTAQNATTSSTGIVDENERNINASNCISDYDTYIVANGSGRSYVYADLYTLYRGSLSATIILQEYQNGTWRQVASWNKSSSSNSIVFSTTYYGTKGKKYRAISYYTANAGGYYDSRMKTSNTATVY